MVVLGLLLALTLRPFDLRPSTFDLRTSTLSFPRYSAAHLACAAFLEDVRTTVEAQRGMTPVRERGHRTGRLVWRARPAGEALRFEAWYDSLRVWHETAAGRLAPDADGLIGGRWRGTLTPAGDVALEVRPFMPPDVAAAADLSDVPLDFLPPLPRGPVAPGARWTGPDGLVVERLADSAGAERYRWRLATTTAVPGLGPDSAVVLRQEAEDEGRLAWTAALGATGWDRVVTIETRVAAGARTGAAVRGKVEQRISVRRALVGIPADC